MYNVNKLMFNRKKLPWLLLLFIVFSVESNAALQLNRTRVIYNENGDHELIVSNPSTSLYGGQVWVEGEDSNASTNFVTSPQLFKIDVDKKQIVRIYQTNATIETERESLFWLNVQEIPPKTMKGDQNGIVLAFRHKIKLLHRPATLSSTRIDAEQQITAQIVGKRLILNNPTPFYFAVANVMVNNNTNLTFKKDPFKPFSSLEIDLTVNNIDSIKISAIDDYGAVNEFELAL